MSGKLLVNYAHFPYDILHIKLQRQAQQTLYNLTRVAGTWSKSGKPLGHSLQLFHPHGMFPSYRRMSRR